MQTARFQKRTAVLLGMVAGLVRLVRNKAQLQQVRIPVVNGEQVTTMADSANWATLFYYGLHLLEQIKQKKHGAWVSTMGVCTAIISRRLSVMSDASGISKPHKFSKISQSTMNP